MEIKLLDKNSIFLKGKKESVWINPDKNEWSTKKDLRIILLTNNDFGKDVFWENEKIIISGPGEYEIGGIEILGVNGEDGNTVYRLVIDGVAVVVLGKIQQELSAKRIDKLDSTDVLLAPTTIGDKPSFKLVKEWAKKWGANYLIPVSDVENDLKGFLDMADEEGLEPLESLKVEKADLPDGMEMKLLKRS